MHFYKSKIGIIIKWAIAIIIYYCYIYSPPFVFVPFGLDKLVFIFAIFYISYKKTWLKLFKCFSKEFFCLFLITIISLFISIIHRQQFILFLYDLILLIEAIPTSWALWYFFQSIEIGNKNKIIIFSAIIAGILTLFLISHPIIMQTLKENFLKYPDRLKTSFIYRGYGLSDGLFFSFPVIQGYCLGMLLMNIKRWNPIVSILMIVLGILCVMVNARSGFVPIIVAIIITMCQHPKTILKILVIGMGFVYVLSSIVVVFVESNELLNTAVEWSLSTVDIVKSFFNGEKVENIDALTGDMLFFPRSIDEWLIGTGLNASSSDKLSHNSDIGYVIRLMFGGLIYVVFWIVLCILMIKRLWKIDKALTCLLFISLVYLNYKADFFVLTPSSRFLFMIYVWSILSRYHNNLQVEHYLHSNYLK